MKVSIIIPIYNGEKYLDVCLKSVVSQTYKNLEIILIDDGSTDSSPEICDKWSQKDDRIIVVHKKNGGLSDARNKGLDIMSGENVFFLDADDVLDINTIKILIDEMMCSKAEIVSSNLKQFRNNSELEYGNKDVQFIRKTNELFYLEVISNHACGKLYKSYLFNDIRYPINRNYEDVATTHLLYKKANAISHTNVGLYLYRIHENTITGCISEKNLNDLKWAYKNVKKVYPRKEKYEYYLLTILYTLFRTYARADKKMRGRLKLDKYIRKEFRDIKKDIKLYRFLKKSPLAIKIILYDIHLAYVLLKCTDVVRKIKCRS